jgi:hypothetical protein
MIMAKPTTPKPPARRPLPDHLRWIALVAVPVVLVITFVVAAVATSRGAAHTLSPLALVTLVGGVAVMLVAIGFPAAMYSGALDVISEEAVLHCEPGCRAEPGDDPWSPRQLWRSSLLWSAVVALWSVAGAGLVAVALNGKHSALFVTWIVLAGIAGLAAIVSEVVGRQRGAHAARAVGLAGVTVTPLRRRAWLHVALPVGICQALVNAGAAWVLFHDYSTGDAFAPKALTRSVALADKLVIVVIISVVFGMIGAAWGGVDATIGRVSLDEPGVQQVSPKSPMGVQIFVWLAIAGLILATLATALLPNLPSLAAVMFVRGLFAGVLVFATTGIAYARGVLNGRAALAAATNDEATAAPVAPARRRALAGSEVRA